MAHMDGSGPGIDTNVVPFALARLEQLIQVRLAESLEGGDEPAITVTWCEEERTDSYTPEIPDDPRFYDAVVDKIVETLDHYLDDVEHGAELSASALNEEIENAFLDATPRECDHFLGLLRCMSCGIISRDENAACETFLRNPSTGTAFRVGDAFTFDRDLVASDYYAHIDPQADTDDVHVIEGWACPHCTAVNWAEITLRDERVASVWSIELSQPALERAHYVTSECVELAARITGRPAWALLGDNVFEILFEALGTT